MEYEIKIKFDDGRTIELTGKQASELHGILDRLYGRHEYIPTVPYIPYQPPQYQPPQWTDPYAPYTEYPIITSTSKIFLMKDGN